MYKRQIIVTGNTVIDALYMVVDKIKSDKRFDEELKGILKDAYKRQRMISLSGRTDVKIEFTGLRHGEELYEELLNVKELTKPTYHEKRCV